MNFMNHADSFCSASGHRYFCGANRGRRFPALQSKA